MKTHIWAPEKDKNVRDAVAEALSLAQKEQVEVVFRFKGMTFRVMPDSNPEAICRDGLRVLEGLIPARGGIGPHPPLELTEEEIRRDNVRRKEIEEAKRAFLDD